MFLVYPCAWDPHKTLCGTMSDLNEGCELNPTDWGKKKSFVCLRWTAIFFTKPWENFLDSFDMWMARQCSTFRCGEQPGQARACQHTLQINKVLVTVIFFQGEFPVGRNWPGWSKGHIVKRFERRPEEETLCGHGTYWRPKGRHLVLLYAWVKRIFDWVSVKPKPV